MTNFSFVRFFSQETRLNFKLCLPMIMGQVGQLFLPIIDTLMVARLGANPLAGVGLGGTISVFFLVIGIGLCSAVHVYTSHAYSKYDVEASAHVLKHGVFIVFLYAVPLILFIHLNSHLLAHLGQPSEVLHHATPYLIYTIWSILPALIFRCFRNFLEAWHRPWIPFWMTVLFILLNIFLNWVLIFGKYGITPMGAAGAGLATLIARIAGVIILLIIILKLPPFSLLKIYKKTFFVFSLKLLKKMLLVGLSAFFQIAFEIGYFSSAIFMMGWLSAEALAAQQIVFNYTGFIFMIPLSISFVMTIRISSSIAKNPEPNTLARIAFNGILLSTLLMAFFALNTFFLRKSIPTFFIDNPTVIAIASDVLLFVAFYQVFDGIQVTSMGALRGIPDLKIPLLIVFVGYWLIGIPLAYLFAFTLGYGTKGLWLGLSFGIVLVALSLLIRLKHSISQQLSIKQ